MPDYTNPRNQGYPYNPSAPPGGTNFGITDPTDTKQLSTGIVGAAGTMSGQGNQAFSAATSFLGPVMRQEQKIATGDRAETLEAAAPQIATITDQYDTAFKAAQNNMTRGGGRNAVAASLPFQKASAIETTLQGTKTQAMKDLATQSLSLASLGLSAEQGGLEALTNIFGTTMQANAQNQGALLGALGDIGGAIGTSLFGVGGLFSKG